MNQVKKVAFIRVEEYGSLVIYTEFINTCHKTNIIFQTTGEDASSLNSKSEIPNKKIANITRDLLLE